jgi:peptidoglycan hydrolase-like protein with peptidoglycan-binding domain
MRVYLTTYFDTEDPTVDEGSILDLIDSVMLDLQESDLSSASSEISQIVENLNYNYYDSSDTDEESEI